MEKGESKIVMVYPTPLVITKKKDTYHYESKLNLSNLTNDYVIFKVYNNKHTLYSAKPSASFIKPKETAHVLIKRFSGDQDESAAGKDKFILCFYTINKIINNNDEAKEALKSNLYNEDSKQETMLYVVLKEQEKEDFTITPQYDETNLEDIGTDYAKGIEYYQDLNEKMRQDSNIINQRIKELENTIAMIEKQRKLKDDKDRAILDNPSKNKNNQNSNKKIFLICIILLGLIIGANLANLFNKMFDNKQIIKDSNYEIINNKSIPN